MRNSREKLAILGALRSDPDFSGLAAMPSLRSKKGVHLLRWLDQSGLAMNLLSRIPSHQSGAKLPDEWRNALQQRRERNTNRLRNMLEEFWRLNTAFRARGVFAVTLKGFSLVPDFCRDARDRHQTDFDFLVDSTSVQAAAEVLRSFGYSTPQLSRTEESCFTTPLHHIPSLEDDLYSIQNHRQVDLHVSLSERSAWMNTDVPGDCLRHALPSTLCGVEFYALTLADRFLCQVLHLFRHAFRSWIRLSWLMEIGRCMELHGENTDLWTRVIERAGSRSLTKRIFAFVLSLTNRLFRYRIPSQIRSWASDGMSPSIRAWLDHFSEGWAIADWPGTLTNVFLAPDFIPDRKLRKEYLLSRLIPKQKNLSIGEPANQKKNKSLGWNFRRSQYLLHRSSVHCRDLFRLPLDEFRWRRALDDGRPISCELEC
jgi:hypothetical protein